MVSAGAVLQQAQMLCTYDEIQRDMYRPFSGSAFKPHMQKICNLKDAIDVGSLDIYTNAKFWNTETRNRRHLPPIDCQQFVEQVCSVPM